MSFEIGGNMEIKPELFSRNKTTQESWLDHIKEWNRSKLSQEAYCKKAGIKYSTFVYWRGQFLLESGQSKSKQFVPVKIKQATPDLSQSIKIKMLTGNIICIPLSIGIPEVAKLIRLLELTNNA
jgi:hypothetical protein